VTGLVGEPRAHVAEAGNRRILAAVLISAAGVAAITGLVLALRPFVPAVSLGVLYILAVLPVAVVWGRAYAGLVAVVSMLVFNFVFLPPTLTFTLTGGENWLVLAVYLITGLLVSDLATRARRRAREAEQREREAAFLAELSSGLLSGVEISSQLPRIAEGAARVLEVPSARVELGQPFDAAPDEIGIDLVARDVRVGSIYVPREPGPNASVRVRFLPALASVLGIALDRQRLAREALETETLRRSDVLKTALLRTVSHDLRSPLTAIRASLEALESADLTLDETQRGALIGAALAATELLDRTVRNLLDLSRLEAGAAHPRPTLRTIESLLDQVLAHTACPDQRIHVSVPTELPLVDVDPIQIEHAVVNLLENALKFSPPGSRVAVGVEGGRDEVRIRVADEGPGLPPGELERVFEPFDRGSTSRRRGGEGLGLAIAKGFVEANGGRVWAESGSGGGASFVVALPAARVPAPAGEP
jgi:two-component system sensor histidine kinase KdpD